MTREQFMSLPDKRTEYKLQGKEDLKQDIILLENEHGKAKWVRMSRDTSVIRALAEFEDGTIATFGTDGDMEYGWTYTF